MSDIHVQVTGDDRNDGLTPGTAKKSMVAGLRALSPGGKLVLGAGTFAFGGNVPSGVSIVGAGQTAGRQTVFIDKSAEAVELVEKCRWQAARAELAGAPDWLTNVFSREYPELAKGPCGRCDHVPACGHASVTRDDEETWYCHTDDHSCYRLASL